jgi:hypothetical protein
MLQLVVVVAVVDVVIVYRSVVNGKAYSLLAYMP